MARFGVGLVLRLQILSVWFTKLLTYLGSGHKTLARVPLISLYCTLLAFPVSLFT